MRYWLFKTEPNVYSLDDLKKAGQDTWDGIRNYQARNFIRDDIRVGDRVLIYHSRVETVGIVGEARVVKAGYPDFTQFDPKAKYYDAKADPNNPRWYMVDVAYVRHFPQCLALADLKKMPALASMMLVQKGSRLSIQPVSEDEWKIIQDLAGS